MRNKYAIYAGLIAAIVFVVTGCSSQRSLERNFDTSYKLQKFGQTLNPQAEKNLEPVYGFDGQAADRTVAKYEKSFEKAAPPPVYNFSISTGGR